MFTLPGRRRLAGRIHPITTMAGAIKKILIGLGFAYDDYPDNETEYYDFDALEHSCKTAARKAQRHRIRLQVSDRDLCPTDAGRERRSALGHAGQDQNARWSRKISGLLRRISWRPKSVPACAAINEIRPLHAQLIVPHLLKAQLQLLAALRTGVGR
jgi:hypothetical protein